MEQPGLTYCWGSGRGDLPGETLVASTWAEHELSSRTPGYTPHGNAYTRAQKDMHRNDHGSTRRMAECFRVPSRAPTAEQIYPFGTAAQLNTIGNHELQD